MQQLDLFGGNKSRGLRPRVKSKRKNRNRGPVGGWDLWTQETESEKELALFFLDIRNFTPLVERQQAANVIHLVKKLFSTFQHIIRNYRGRIIETSGDGFYAAFGFDADVKNAVNAAVQAGMVILKTLDDLNSRSFEHNLRRRIEVGIGVHVGKVATGNLHLGSSDHFVVMGYPVNVASRLQAATKELNNNFIVSAEVYRILHHPQPAALVKMALKGVSNPCELHLIGKAYAASKR